MTNQFHFRVGRTAPPPSLTGRAPKKSGSNGRRLRAGLHDAQDAIRDGNAPEALEILEALRERHPVNPHVMVHLGRARGAAGDLPGALDVFYRAKEHTSNSPIVDLFLAEAFLQHDALAEAEEAVRRCLRAEKHNLVAHNLLALCLFRQERFLEAFREWNQSGWSHNLSFLVEFTISFERFLLQAPEAPAPELPADPAAGAVSFGVSPRAGRWNAFRLRLRVNRLLDKAEGMLTAQKTVDAWRTTGEALALTPDHPEAMLLRAVALYELGRYHESARLLLRVVRQDRSMLPRCFLAYCLLRLGDVETAEQVLSKARVEGPYDYYMHYHLGLCHLIRGDLPRARKYFGIAYRDFFIDSREYCFEYLVQKVKAAVRRLGRDADAANGGPISSNAD